ncbi:MAG: cobalamin-dependent protein [Candidatus Marinimicrobia bacterium]|jgi:methylmalonyl-CoA mutase C-terminal domain/subunit|nr:methylmalonyl-CoA mutase [Candidatus Neomarinimicrobiota bacterium]MDP6401807.1 cobalamin-dependent protein [Candidatus Neomarinimicrobiota bacterium]MDP6615500.1 cobalamin-dependent protein [Candidatus Neomarinimicrobiota bacterium]|tara:strand:+ start:390 stop:764 length:375 start_codon:yes stop_codon:yes gene_type:complete
MKVLLSKPGLDGHDVGVKVLAYAVKDAGFEVAYSGLRKSIEEIVEKATDIKADVIGLSILSGSHLILCEKMRDVMSKSGLTIPWLVGGNIPHGDVDTLINLGAAAAFPTGTTVEEVVHYLKEIE